MTESMPAHADLADLEQRIAKARQAERAAREDLVRADAAVEAARDQVREAHDLGADPAKPTAALQKAKAATEQAQLATEGVSRRVARSIADRDRFVEENAMRLLDELRPESEQVVADIKAAAESLLAANSAWQALSVRVSYLLMAANRRPADDAPGEHELTEVVRELRRSMPDRIRTPMPHDSVPRTPAVSMGEAA